MQTAQACVDALLRKRPADFIPLHDSFWDDALRQWVAQGYPAKADGKPEDPVVHFGLDLVGCGGFRWEAKLGPQEVLEETPEWKIVRNGNGGVLKWWKSRSGTPEHIGFHMTSREVWEREYRPLLVDASLDRQRVNVPETAKALAKWRETGKWICFGTMFIWEFMRASLGDFNMFVALAEEPEWVHDIGRVYTGLAKRTFRILLDEAGRPDGAWIYEDLGYRDRLFCSPAAYEALIFPYYREMVEFFHGYDLPVVLHSCGYQEPAIPLIVAAGFDGLNPMEVKAGNNILRYAEQWGDRLAFFGGLDVRILESGDRAVIRKGVTDFIGGMKARGARFAFGSDHSVTTGVRYADYQYALEVYRELRA